MLFFEENAEKIAVLCIKFSQWPALRARKDITARKAYNASQGIKAGHGAQGAARCARAQGSPHRAQKQHAFAAAAPQVLHAVSVRKLSGCYTGIL